MIVELRNDFHHTSTVVRVSASLLLFPHQVRRIRRTLCGVLGCGCGGLLSERGPQRLPNSSLFVPVHGDRSGTVRLETNPALW